ncbi:ubiquinone biosynthesis monooxygenase Coq7 [Litorivivens lipolytica]|uniref:3-demethoxyubiquinol 3-hydroxylase n=1 Tax=Litorivivens lipolytica TaxID=1524264 RepID=A0A7W4W657_9GAMM|nr:2-polyprenyl-3-methyl-6-methoxy-1,4-benzoquinone monooxygenase [Litorivivens lipolytica]MBB3048145.1 ubiquinone biosynthesis monooxygenase Coq7 [Litorivivens lipolytica]
MNRRFSLVDQLVISLDRGLKTLVPGSASPRRNSPADHYGEALLDDSPRHTTGLMRINHTGEVCAQALYHGQALTAKDPAVRAAMQHSADEEIDHLAWCEQRLNELGSHTSRLNPLFYAASFTLGAVAGTLGDRISLGFVAATEEQVCKHLQDHLEQLPPEDGKSRAILQQMLADESAHASKAIEAGGQDFAPGVKDLMTLASKVMTGSTYYI